MFAEHGITVAPPPVIWREPSVVEVDLMEIPPTLRRGHPEAWVRGGQDHHQSTGAHMSSKKSRLREENGVRLPRRVWRVVDCARDGQRLCKSLRKKETGETEVEFALEPSLRRVPTKSAKEAIESGLLKPCGDGLFGADTSQTWVAA